jgi:hypothetical protein
MEEVGPKISKALEAAGIQTLAQPAQASETNLEACHLLRAVRRERNMRRSCSMVMLMDLDRTPNDSSPVVNPIHCRREWREFPLTQQTPKLSLECCRQFRLQHGRNRVTLGGENQIPTVL